MSKWCHLLRMKNNKLVDKEEIKSQVKVCQLDQMMEISCNLVTKMRVHSTVAVTNRISK